MEWSVENAMSLCGRINVFFLKVRSVELQCFMGYFQNGIQSTTARIKKTISDVTFSQPYDVGNIHS